jgi:hypothetical protein
MLGKDYSPPYLKAETQRELLVLCSAVFWLVGKVVWKAKVNKHFYCLVFAFLEVD